MLRPVGLKQKSLCQWGNFQFRTIEQELTDLNAEWGASWFAGTDIWDVLRL
jgi:hypothetical protein